MNRSNLSLKATNLNPLFTDQIVNFAHLITKEPQTKEDFLSTVKSAYCLSNPKTELFYLATEKSTFETIRYCRVSNCILFNS